MARSLAAIGAAILASFAVVIALAAIGRFFGLSVMWMEEYTSHYMVTVSVLGLAYASVKGVHIKLEFVVKRLPKRVRFMLDFVYIAIYTCWFIFLTKLMYSWFSMALVSGAKTVQMGTPMWIIYLIFLVGLCSVALASLVLFIGLITLRE